jgi:hypothetical protein
MKASQEEFKDSNQEEIKASKEEIIAEMKDWHKQIKACQEPGEPKLRLV